MPLPRRALSRIAAALVPLGAAGCLETAAWVAMPFVYRRAALPDERVRSDLPYRSDGAADPAKHRLDLYLPDPAQSGAPPWPVLVFVHGGGWTSGDRSLRVGGRDVYGNIGRFYAARGVATAIVSYRLQFDVTWREQVDDVARAVAWLHQNIPRYGGDANALFLAGHSAGAHLVNRVALDAELTRRLGLSGVCGLVSVSGAALDLTDEETYALGASRDYYEARFRNGDPGEAWADEASPASFVTAAAPASLLLYAEGDWPALKRQAQVFGAKLERAGVPRRVLEIPDEDHYTIVLALSRAPGLASQSVLDFVRATSRACAPSALQRG
ncbi:MAG: alpha/beta hydrolase [Myxococcales bacterium]|nr:alpha/beta hydrolase [Myxococcales bacterium]